MQLNIMMKDGAVLFIGGDPAKGQAPLITAQVGKPQILIDQEKNTIVIIETKQEETNGNYLEENSLRG